MSDKELRSILHEVIADIDTGRIRTWSPRILRLAGPPLLAASLGLAGCGDTTVSSPQDASVLDARSDSDITPPLDAAYMAPFDASVDSGSNVDYAAPFDASVDSGSNVDYAAPFDGGTDGAL